MQRVAKSWSFGLLKESAALLTREKKFEEKNFMHFEFTTKRSREWPSLRVVIPRLNSTFCGISYIFVRVIMMYLSSMFRKSLFRWLSFITRGFS